MAIEMQGMVPLLQVFDMRASIAFYCDVIGFEIVSNSPPRDDVMFHWALLRRDGIELMLNTAYDEGQQPDVPDARRVAAHDDTGLFIACPDVDAAYAYLREKGIAEQPPKVAPYGMKQLYVRDPDGYGLCFQCPVKEQATASA